MHEPVTAGSKTPPFQAPTTSSHVQFTIQTVHTWQAVVSLAPQHFEKAVHKAYAYIPQKACCGAGLLSGRKHVQGGMGLCSGGMGLCSGGTGLCSGGMGLCSGGMGLSSGGMRLCSGGMGLCQGGMGLCQGGMGLCQGGNALGAKNRRRTLRALTGASSVNLQGRGANLVATFTLVLVCFWKSPNRRSDLPSPYTSVKQPSTR